MAATFFKSNPSSATNAASSALTRLLLGISLLLVCSPRVPFVQGLFLGRLLWALCDSGGVCTVGPFLVYGTYLLCTLAFQISAAIQEISQNQKTHSKSYKELLWSHQVKTPNRRNRTFKLADWLAVKILRTTLIRANNAESGIRIVDLGSLAALRNPK